MVIPNPTHTSEDCFDASGSAGDLSGQDGSVCQSDSEHVLADSSGSQATWNPGKYRNSKKNKERSNWESLKGCLMDRKIHFLSILSNPNAYFLSAPRLIKDLRILKLNSWLNNRQWLSNPLLYDVHFMIRAAGTSVIQWSGFAWTKLRTDNSAKYWKSD